MNAILKEITPNTINFYIEKNLDDFYTKSSQHPNFNSRIEDKISWVLATKVDWPDCIFKADFENLDANREINHIKKLIQNQKAPYGWTVGPLTKPCNLGVLLENCGFSKVYHQAGMAIELQTLNNQVLQKNQLKIRVIQNKRQLEQWVNVVSTVFSIQVDFELLEYLLLESEAQFYLGQFKGKPVTALMLFLSSGVAGLHAVSTLLEFRSRGFGLVISKKALLDAYDMGYKVGVLQASTLGERIYRKLGFKKFCDILSYELEIEKKF